MLVRVVAPHFVAGIVLAYSVVVHAAPILRWTVGKDRLWLSEYFRSKGWTATIMKERAHG